MREALDLAKEVHTFFWNLEFCSASVLVLFVMAWLLMGYVFCCLSINCLSSLLLESQCGINFLPYFSANTIKTTATPLTLHPMFEPMTAESLFFRAQLCVSSLQINLAYREFSLFSFTLRSPIFISYCRSIWLHFVSSRCSFIWPGDIISWNIFDTWHTWFWSDWRYRGPYGNSSERIFSYNIFSCRDLWTGNSFIDCWNMLSFFFK